MADISKRRVDIFVTHQAFINIITLEKRTPFFISTAVNGNAAYIGPAAMEPSKIARVTPVTPDSLPIYFINISRGIQTSISPRRSIIGGSTENICIKLDLAFRRALIATPGVKIHRKNNITKEDIKKEYLLRRFSSLLKIISPPFQ